MIAIMLVKLLILRGEKNMLLFNNKPPQQLAGLLDQRQATFAIDVGPRDQHLEIFVQMEQVAFFSCLLSIFLPFHFEPVYKI